MAIRLLRIAGVDVMQILVARLAIIKISKVHVEHLALGGARPVMIAASHLLPAMF